MEKYTGRKFLLAAFGIVSSCVLAGFGKLTGEYVTVVTVVIGAFNAADAYITGRTTMPK